MLVEVFELFAWSLSQSLAFRHMNIASDTDDSVLIGVELEDANLIIFSQRIRSHDPFRGSLIRGGH